MALDTVPWFIGGGAEHSPAIARQLAYAATSGATGINGSADLRVTSLPTPTDKVRIMPGGGVMLNRYPGGGQQSYTVRNPSATDVDVPATGSSSGATRYLIIRVDDPEFGGQTPSNVRTGPYVRPVLVSSLVNLAYPYLPLAKIVMPANTATITQGMITDMREMANPRRISQVFMGAPVVNQRPTTVGGIWPSYRPSVDVPEWASYVSIIATITSIGHLGGNTEGQLTATLGNGGPNSSTQVRAANHGYDVDVAPGAGVRHTFVVGGKAKVPAALRGTSQPVGMEAIQQGTGAGYLFTVKGSNVIYQVTFTEEAD